MKRAPSSTSSASPTAADPATIGRRLQIKGEVIGSESLYIDGNVEGAINLPDSRVTVSRGALVSANITAREVVVFGKVSGNIYASGSFGDGPTNATTRTSFHLLLLPCFCSTQSCPLISLGADFRRQPEVVRLGFLEETTTAVQVANKSVELCNHLHLSKL